MLMKPNSDNECTEKGKRGGLGVSTIDPSCRSDGLLQLDMNSTGQDRGRDGMQLVCKAPAGW
jgi:hypothetical protein